MTVAETPHENSTLAERSPTSLQPSIPFDADLSDTQWIHQQKPKASLAQSDFLLRPLFLPTQHTRTHTHTITETSLKVEVKEVKQSEKNIYIYKYILKKKFI